VEVDDLKKITNALTVLCSEKQKQEKVRLVRVSAAGRCLPKVLVWKMGVGLGSRAALSGC